MNITTVNTLSLQLFRAVIANGATEDEGAIVNTEYGFVTSSAGKYAVPAIVKFFEQSTLDGNSLNQTFHKSWKKIRDSDRVDLLIDQILHYFSTYGTNFEGEIYIPNEVLSLPAQAKRIAFVGVEVLSADALIDKCLQMFQAGIALTDETIDTVFSLLTALDYQFTGNEKITNKEAVARLTAVYGIMPSTAVDVLRVAVFLATDSSLLIKSRESIQAIKDSSYDPTALFEQFGLERMAEIFKRFKPLFLAFKRKCPSTINRISRLSNYHHKPMATNALNTVTSHVLDENDAHWLANATPYALFKAISTCYARVAGQQDFVYRIRNGKAWVPETMPTVDVDVCQQNLDTLVAYVVAQYGSAFRGKKIFIPSNVRYALPTSEKMFVGNIPTGTTFYGDMIAAGIYWRNEWGARDIDLSGLNKTGKVGWNARYNDSNRLMYSGDMTNAPDGAVEYLWWKSNGKVSDTLVTVNIFSGSDDCKYKIVVGEGSKVSREYMMNPNKVIVDVATQSIQKQNILGLLHSSPDRGNGFTLLNFGMGSAHVSRCSSTTDTAAAALIQQWKNCYTLNDLVVACGGELCDDQAVADIDLSVAALTKSTFVDIFSDKE